MKHIHETSPEVIKHRANNATYNILSEYLLSPTPANQEIFISFIREMQTYAKKHLLNPTQDEQKILKITGNLEQTFIDSCAKSTEILEVDCKIMGLFNKLFKYESPRFLRFFIENLQIC